MPIGVKTENSKILSQIDSLDFIDAKLWIAQLGADLLAGQGVVIKSENPAINKCLQDVVKENKFDDLFLDIVKQVNYWGMVVLTISKTKAGNFILDYSTPELFQDVANIEITPFYAKLMKKKVVGQRVWFVNEVWTTTEVRRSLSVADKTGTAYTYDFDTHGEIPADLDILPYEKHNLGFVPFIQITNKPNRNLAISMSGGYQQLADDYAVRHMPLHINNGLRQMYKEEVIAKSRLAGNIPLTDLKKTGIDGLFAADAFIETESMGNGTQAIATMPSSYDGMKWLEPQKQKLNLYARGCGYSDIFPTENAQTEAETLYSKDNNQRTAKAKRRRYTELFNDLFSKLLVYKGLMTSLDAEREFSIEIKENVVYNQLQLVEFIKSAMDGQFPLMTHKEAVMMQRDLDDEETAEEIVKELVKQADEAMEKDMQLLNDPANDAGGMGKAGNGKDPETTKEGKG